MLIMQLKGVVCRYCKMCNLLALYIVYPVYASEAI